MALTVAVSGAIRKNDGGTVLQAGNVSDKLRDLSLATNTIASGLKGYGTIVVQDVPSAPTSFNDPHGVTVARSGTFAYSPAPGTNYLLVGAGDNAANINGSGSTVLLIPGGSTGQVINKIIKSTQIGTYATSRFNVLALPSSGNFPGLTRGTGAGSAVTYVAPSGNGLASATDDAATPTRAVPGELTYRFGAALPTRNVAYKAKDSNE